MPPFELREALRYMGVRGEPTTELMQLAQEAGTLLTKAANYRWRSVRLPLHWDGSALLLGELPLTGQSIRRHLGGCTEAILLCGTLGSGVDQLIRREMLLHPARALAVNGCAAALLEARLDDTCAALAQTLHAEGLTLTARFSPGYGDLPLTLQGSLLTLLEAYRIGLTLNAGGQLQPEKSVTALCGIGASTQTARGCGHACSSCPNTDCAYRRQSPGKESSP